MITDVIDSVFQPGVNTGFAPLSIYCVILAGLIQFVAILFGLLVVTLLGIMLFIEFNIHLFFLLFLSVGVFASLMW